MHTPHTILQQVFKHSDFRPQQEEIINHVLSQKDTLAILPTGGGKSLCYQVPGILLHGICIVVTPLIALMKDQVKQLKNKNIQALAVYSGMTQREVKLIYEEVEHDKIKFLFLSPERLKSELFIEYASAWNIGLLVVDEAHCISQWGYDFRPSYLEINELRKLTPQTPVIALTASATPVVQKDIIEKLCFLEHRTFFSSFVRSNLSYTCFEVENKLVKTIQILQKYNCSSIVYCRTRKQTQLFSEALNAAGLYTDFYHAGLSQAQRHSKQELWFENKIPTIVCTNAFGMGIDKSDVRLVIHVDIPDSPEAYYQEAGRVGRDGNKAYAVLLIQKKDILDLEKGIQLKYPPLSFLKKVYEDVHNYLSVANNSGLFEHFDFDIIDFCKRFKNDVVVTINAIKIIEQLTLWSLSEGFLLPSRVHTLCTESELYALEKYEPTLYILIQQVLRMYGGTWNTYVNIRETQLAKKLVLDAETVIQQLQKLHALHIIDYIPSTEKPQLQLLHQRIPLAFLKPDTTFIEWLKTKYTERVHSIINYTQSNICRQQYLANYFGENTTVTCGICDTCLRKNTTFDSTFFDNVKNNIWSTLEKQATINIAQFKNKYNTMQQEEVLKIIRHLIDDGHLKINSFGELLKTEA